ncbi:hypothetical protein NDU88_009358 [Pleurodeles waltl]|uniref:Uncharacterized protein n=1 Tax=Pleurodeles waltl TaxID=8319 RepID=A0AAV7PZ77_PLEWA|nr:hypothetical protein NDU88_009358 [Pleurodeles waltl]
MVPIGTLCKGISHKGLEASRASSRKAANVCRMSSLHLEARKSGQDICVMGPVFARTRLVWATSLGSCTNYIPKILLGACLAGKDEFLQLTANWNTLLFAGDAGKVQPFLCLCGDFNGLLRDSTTDTGTPFEGSAGVNKDGRGDELAVHIAKLHLVELINNFRGDTLFRLF